MDFKDYFVPFIYLTRKPTKACDEPVLLFKRYDKLIRLTFSLSMFTFNV